jgi:DNA replication initiation complex subunit (GINS family)
MPSSEEESSDCSHCRKPKKAAEFKRKPDGSLASTCLECQKRSRESARQKKAAEKDNTIPGDDPEEDDGRDLAVLLETFLNALVQQDDNLELTARVNISSVSGTRKDKANEIAVRIWNRMKYQFVYVTI